MSASISNSKHTLSTNGLSAGAAQNVVVQDVTITVETGKTLVILGPNGSGKSTILKTIARQIAPLKGTVSLNSSDIWTLPAAAFAQLVAYVPQNNDPEIQLTVEEYVSLGRSPHQKWWQWQQTEIDKEVVKKALADTGLSELRARLVSELSGGERQRTAIAMALAQRPSFLLLDEPTAHLDFKHQADLMYLLHSLQRGQTSDQKPGLIVVLHDLSAAAYLADDILLLKKSATESTEIAAYAPAKEVLQESILEGAFGVKFTTVGNDALKEHYFVRLDNYQPDQQNQPEQQ